MTDYGAVFRLDGKAVLVTRAARGVGAAADVTRWCARTELIPDGGYTVV